MEELDEFGIPIKKTSTPQSAKIEMDEFGIPLKKKEPSTTTSSTGYKSALSGIKGTSTPPTESGIKKSQGVSQSPLKTAATTTQLDFTRPQPRLSAEEQQAQGMVTKQQKAEKALELKEGVKQKLYDNNRYWLLQNKKEAQENGMTLKELQASRRKELANNYLDDSEQREANSILDHLDAKKSGDDKRAGEALKQYYAAKNEQRAKFQSDMQNLQAEYDNIASRIEGGELDADLGLQTLSAIQKRQKNLEIGQKAFLKPKEALKNFVQENATEIASVSKPTQTPYEQLEEYTNNLYAKVRQLKADLGYQDMGKGATLGGYAQDYAIRAEQDGGDLLDELYAEELKLKTATKLLLLNRTPIQADETALGVLGKSFGNSLAPNLQKEQGTAVTIANNVKEIVEDAKIGEKVYEEQKKFAEESAKPYERYSAKWFAEPVGASLAIVPEFVIGSLISEGVLGVTKLGKLLTIAEKYGKIKGLNTTAKYVNAINKNVAGKVADSIGKTFIKVQANGLKFGATSELVSKLFPSQEDEIGFINGYFGGNIGKGAELALSGAVKNMFKVFGNKGTDAIKRINEFGGTLKLLKDAPKTVIGEIGEEFGESLGQIYKDSDSWKQIGEKIKEQYGTLDKATEFVVLTGIMALGMGSGNSIGSNLFTASKEAYNNLPREQRAIVDAILDEAKEADKEVEETVAEDIKKDIAKDLTPIELKEIETTEETTTDGERTIERAVSAGTDVAEEGLGMANEPGGESVTGEGVQAETVFQAPLTAEDIETRRQETVSKIKRKDLFGNVGEFSSSLGGSDKAAVPVSHKVKNNIEFVEYAHPETGSIDVVVTGVSGNDYVGFYRIYENGKPTNKWSSKFENKSRNKDTFKTMIGGVQEMLPKGHEYTETTSISTDGLRVWNQQLSRGYDLQYDNKGNLITNEVAINGDAINNELGVNVDKGAFNDIEITPQEFESVKKALLPYLEKLGLNENNIRIQERRIEETGRKYNTVVIDLPVLKNNKVAEVVSEKVTEVTAPAIEATPKAGSIGVGEDVAIKKLDALKTVNAGDIKNPINTVFVNDIFKNTYEQGAADGMFETKQKIDVDMDDVVKGKSKEGTIDIEVSVNDLVPTQAILDKADIVSKIKGEKANFEQSEKPLVFKKDGKYYIVDGHHRIASDILKGKDKIQVRKVEPSLKETPTSEAKPTESAKVEPAKEATKPTKTERKVIAEAKIDDLAARAKEFLRNKNLPEGTQVSGVSQNKVIDLMASTVKALVNSGIEIAEAIKQVREFFESDYDTSAVKDYEISQAIARDELTDVAKDNGFSSYREAVFAVNKYVREVGKEDVITEEEITKAKEAKDKEAEAPKKGYTSKKKKAQEGEKETTVKETGRSKSYAEGRVPVSEAYNDVVNAQKEYYEQMNRKEELANAEGYLASFGNTEEGLLDAYIDMMEVFRTNPYLDPKNSIAIEILADRMFAMAIDFRDKGQTDKYNNFLEKSEKLRKEAFQAHFRAGQYTSAVAVFSRSANPDAFLIFVEGQQAQEFEKAKKSKPEKIKEYEAAVNDFYEKAKEIKKDAARQAVVSAPNSTTKVNVKVSDKLKARYEQGKARQAEALKKLGKINFFGSSGLSNEAIEAVGELVLSQFEQGIYKAATIIERIIEITEGKLTEKNIKDVYDAYKVNYKGEKLTLTELEEVLRKEEIAEKEPATDIDKALEKEREKLAKIKADYEQAVVDKADALVLKRAQQFVKDQEKKVKEQEDKAKKAATAKTAEGKRPTLSDLIQRELEADSTKEQIAKELVEKGGLSEREANKLAEIYYNKYRKILKEKITSQLLKDLTPKKVKQIEAQMNALKDKPYGKTLGGMIANQVAAGALDSEILRAAFAEKYGLPSISPVQADIIRDLARKARAAKTQLGLQTANKNLLEYVNSFVKPKYGSLLGTLYYMGLLTGVSTAAVNTFGNVNGLINQSTENFVQSVIEAIQGNKGNLMSSSKPAQKILMAIANMNDSLSAAIDILIHGGGESRYSNIKKDAFGEITTEDLIVKRKDFKDLGFKKLFTTLFKLYKTPPALFIRNLPASDEGFTMANFNMEATRELRKKLYAEGYRGADLEKKVYEQVYGTTEIKAKALQEAIKELKRIGIDPANRKILANRIAKEIIANSLDEKVQNVANEVAKENTFRGKPRGMAGYLSRKIPQTWLISPFVTTPSRILEKHMNYIPLYGIARYYGYGFSDTLRKTFPGLEKDFTRKGIESSKREGELRNKQLAQVLATHALLLVFWGLSQIDWEDEKGNVVPFVDASAGYMGTDIEERKKLEDLMPAYMIRIGNFKFSYKTNPLLAMIALPLGVIKDAERSFEAADYSKSAFAYNFELFNFLYESNPIEGYQDFFEGLSKSFRTIKEEMTLESIAALPVKMAADFSSNVAVDNFYKQIVDFTDPLVHEAQDLMEVIYKAFNMEKIGDLTPTHDRWGRPVKRYPGESFFPLQHLFNNNDDKKITEWEIKNGIEIPTINRKTLVLTNNTLKTEKSIKNQREELVKDYGLTSDKVKYFDEALNSDFKLLTKDEWNKMSETIRYDVFTIIKNNFENATEEYKKLYKLSVNDQQRDADIKPISKLSRPEAKKLVEILFETKRRDYINKNFTKIEQK